MRRDVICARARVDADGRLIEDTSERVSARRQFVSCDRPTLVIVVVVVVRITRLQLAKTSLD